ncbi:MAG: glycosyltransferase [Longimicrobiales bacterium]|nr:glycosyltransferase [Longimicrobiales bacterium]
MKILHVTAPDEVGGLESVVLGLALGHRRNGRDVQVAAIMARDPERDHPFLASLREGGIPTHILVASPRAYLRERRWVRTLCRELRPDVVHTHGFRPDVVDAPVALGEEIPTLTTVHGHNHDGLRERISESLQHRAFRSMDAVVAVSRPLMDRLLDAAVPAERLRLVPNAWRAGAARLTPADARRTLGLPGHGCHVGWVGRLEPEKGPDHLVDALALLGDLPLTASILGKGRMHDALATQIRRLGLADRVRLAGVVPGAARLLTAFDVLVLSSRTEGTPMILLEAMAAEVPIVTTRVGGIPDVVGPNEALLVKPGDPQALARGIREVLEGGPENRKRVRAAARRLEDHFGEAAWLRRYDEIYLETSRRETDVVA